MANVIQTTKTYKTVGGARRALETKLGDTMAATRWAIAVADDGRFAPLVVFDRDRPEMLMLAHAGITVVG